MAYEGSNLYLLPAPQSPASCTCVDVHLCVALNTSNGAYERVVASLVFSKFPGLIRCFNFFIIKPTDALISQIYFA